jgi:predicted MFS family arabinose efflux permease
MNITHDAGRIVRDAATWFGYCLIGLQIYLFTVQGNVIPFLQEEFDLSYGVVGLHSVAMALGVIMVGLAGTRTVAALGRRRILWLSAAGLAAGAILLCISPGAWGSIPSCFIIGVAGGLAASVVPAILTDIHGERRSQAFSEQAIFAYGLAVLGPIFTAICVAQGLGWRTAVLVGAAFGVAIIFAFRSAPIQGSRGAVAKSRTRDRLPPAFWAYWGLMTFTIAAEFSVLLWAPAFLERVVGFETAFAAGTAAGFFAGVIVGRLIVRAIVRNVNPRTILVVAFIIGFIGFVCYWVIGTQPFAIAGIFMLGLCIAPQYPLTMSLGLGVARAASDAAATRFALGFGLAILVAPVALGALADRVGLSLAHLTLPVLLAAAFGCFVAAGVLEKRELHPGVTDFP